LSGEGGEQRLRVAVGNGEDGNFGDDRDILEVEALAIT